GYKSQTFAGGIHTPMFIWWNGRLQKTNGKEFKQLVSAMDFFPTALDAAGIEVPENLDGVSLLPNLRGETNKEVHKALHWITSYS
ncbi:sulfatase-like hydrolase/transferase, partial [Vibrio cholerae]